MLVGEDDRLVLVTSDRAFAVDPIELHEDIECADGHVSLLCGERGGRERGDRSAYARITN